MLSFAPSFRLSGLVMAQSLEKRSGSEEDIPQVPRVVEQKRLAITAKSSKPPRVLKKKVASEPEKEEDDIPSAHSPPEDDLVTNSKTLSSDGNPKKSGHARDRNTAAKMSDQEAYKTHPEGETATERNIRFQRIHHHWAKKWFNYENVQRKY